MSRPSTATTITACSTARCAPKEAKLKHKAFFQLFLLGPRDVPLHLCSEGSRSVSDSPFSIISDASDHQVMVEEPHSETGKIGR